VTTTDQDRTIEYLVAAFGDAKVTDNPSSNFVEVITASDEMFLVHENGDWLDADGEPHKAEEALRDPREK